MLRNKLKRKHFLFLSTIMSLLAVFVCAIATAAWFQLDSQPLQTSLVSGTGSVSLVDNSTYGYKINPTLGGDGKIDYSNNVVTKKNGSTISTTNNNLEGLDDNFDIPDEGIGYYLIEQNAENTFTYNYNSAKMATKFVSKTGGSVNTHYISSKTLAAKKYRVKKYTFVNNQTVYEQVQIKTSNNAGSEITLDATGTNATYDVTINTAGTYKIWLNYSSATSKWDLSLEATSFSVGGLNRLSAKGPSIKKSSSGKAVTGQKFFLNLNGTGQNNDNYWRSSGATIWLALMNSGKSSTEWVQMSLIVDNYRNSVFMATIPSVNWEIKWVIGVRCDSSGSGGWDHKWNQTQDLELTNNNQNCVILSGWDSGRLGTYAKAAVEGTTRYYFYNYYSGNKVFTGSTLYGYAWDNEKEFGRDNSHLGNAAWPGATMTLSGTPNLYYIDVSNSYDRIIFNNNSSQTPDLTLSSSKPYWKPTNASGTTGTWYSSAQYTGATTYYLYDPGRTLMGTGTHYCYYWDSNNKVEAVNSWENAASMSYNTTYGYYSISISNYYNRAIFTTNRGATSNNTQTINLTLNSSKHYYVLSGTTSDNNVTKFTGNWYTSFDTTPIDNVNTTTYYIYDKTNKFGGTAPYAYGYIDNDPSSVTTYHVHYEGTAWPGSQTHNSPLPGGSTNITGLYAIELSDSYDHIIFNNGSRDVQTDDASAALVADCPIFVLDGGEIEEDDITKFTGSWQASLAAITKTALFFTYDGSSYTAVDTTNISGLTSDLGRGATYDGGTYDPGSVSNQDGKDAINGILYHFEPEATYWYTSNSTFNNSTKFTPNSTTLEAGAVNLYKRMICDLRQMTTLYVDASHSGTGASNTYWQNISICGQGGSDTPYFSSNDTGATWKIGTHIYRFTVPSTYTIRIANSGYSSSGGNNTSVNFLVSSRTTSFIVINAASAGNNCTLTDCSDLATNIGTATIYISTNNGSSFDTHYDMSIGDQTSNDFVYELGIRIASGSYIYVDVTETDGTHNYYHYTEYVNDKPTYVADAGDGYHNVKLTSFTGHARFNFYITHNATKANRKLSIAMVPDDGNGYYIMPYSSSLGTNTYSGAIKMSSGSETSASYSGYYASAGETIFIRSYINAVDTIYTSSSYLYTDVSMDTNSANATYGVITFTNAGYYDIDVYNGSVSVNRYLIGDFFKVNALDTASSKIDTIDHIKAQITSLVIEVQFTCNNTYASKMSLTADNDLEAFVGAALYCSASPLDNPYSYLRTNCYSDISSTTGVIDDSNSSFVVPANSASTYYAYILVDYIPTDNGGDYDDFLDDYGGNIYFYLHAKQYIA